MNSNQLLIGYLRQEIEGLKGVNDRLNGIINDKNEIIQCKDKQIDLLLEIVDRLTDKSKQYDVEPF
jgi:hypothetical protein